MQEDVFMSSWAKSRRVCITSPCVCISTSREERHSKISDESEYWMVACKPLLKESVVVNATIHCIDLRARNLQQVCSTQYNRNLCLRSARWLHSVHVHYCFSRHCCSVSTVVSVWCNPSDDFSQRVKND